MSSAKMNNGSWCLLADNLTAHGKDGGSGALAALKDYSGCCVAEYVWIDADGNTRSKTKTLSSVPCSPDDLPVWNFDGSSTGQAPGEDSEILLVPVKVFKDPFRLGKNVLVLTECYTPEMQPAINNHRAACLEQMQKYDALEPWFGIEQEYTLMKRTNVGKVSDIPFGFNDDGSEPAGQGPYYCGAGDGFAIGRKVADEHYAKCLFSGVKVAGINAEVMPGQWEYQVGPCAGIDVSDDLMMSRYIMQRVCEELSVQVTFHPKPREGDWNGAGCHTNFSINLMRAERGLDVINTVCAAFGQAVEEHIAEYGTDNAKRLTGQHETCSINEFKFGVADRGASIRIPRETFANKRGYMEDRRPAANCDPYRVTGIMMKTTGECVCSSTLKPVESSISGVLVTQEPSGCSSFSQFATSPRS